MWIFDLFGVGDIQLTNKTDGTEIIETTVNFAYDRLELFDKE